jgi:quinol monooxygenase YgiN
MIVLLATLTVHPDKVDAFHDYERRAARVMAKHGGRIERVVVLEPDPEDRFYRETHVVTFRDRAALAAYRDDADFQALAALRESCILATAIRYGTAGEDYHG